MQFDRQSKIKSSSYYSPCLAYTINMIKRIFKLTSMHVVIGVLCVQSLVAGHELRRRSYEESGHTDSEPYLNRTKMDEDWDYGKHGTTGAAGPSSWDTIPGDEACGGKNQSPIDIKTKDTIKLRNNKLLFFNYKSYNVNSIRLINNGHTVSIDFRYDLDKVSIHQLPHISGGRLNANYVLVSIHFHWGSSSSQGSEHSINGQEFPMEVHLVHVKETFVNDVGNSTKHPDGIAVVGAFFSIRGSDNRNLNSLLKSIRKVKYHGQTVMIDRFNIYKLLPNRYDILYTYQGSLTTPPCSEAVIWNVLFGKIFISENQMKIFRGLQRAHVETDHLNDEPIGDNFRDRQPENGRTIYSQVQF